jgi:TolA-binding protein
MVVRADFARKLERERDEAREEVGQLKSQLTQTRGAVTISRNGYLQELEQQRDSLAKALQKLRNNESLSIGGAAYEIVEQALQSVTSKP